MKRCKARENCDQVKTKYRQLSVETQDKIMALCASNPVQCQAQYGQMPAELHAFREAMDKAMGNDIPVGLKTDMTVYLMHITTPLP